MAAMALAWIIKQQTTSGWSVVKIGWMPTGGSGKNSASSPLTKRFRPLKELSSGCEASHLFEGLPPVPQLSPLLFHRFLHEVLPISCHQYFLPGMYRLMEFPVPRSNGSYFMVQKFYSIFFISFFWSQNIIRSRNFFYIFREGSAGKIIFCLL